MNAATWVGVLVAVISAAAAFASQRSAAKASTMNTDTTSRVEMEKEAYNRARAFDTETITRQDKRIEELERDNITLHEQMAVARSEARTARAEARAAHAENALLRERIAVLERDHPHNPHEH